MKIIKTSNFEENFNNEEQYEPLSDIVEHEENQVFQDREAEDGSTGNDDITNEQYLKDFGEPGFYACPMGGYVEDYGPFPSIEEAMSVLQLNPGETVEKFQVIDRDGFNEVIDLNQFGNPQ